jgi:hypothetical protein
MINIFGLELFKFNFFMRGLIFSVSLILALHYGLLLMLNAFAAVKKRDYFAVLIALVYAVVACGVFYYVVSGNFIYKVIFYILLTLYILIVLSRAFVNWYSRTEEISKKLDRIIELLEKR